MKKTLLVSCSIVFLFLAASPAYAYVLQGRHVLDLMIAKLGPAKSLFVSERLVYHRMAAAVDEQGLAAYNDTLPPANIAGSGSRAPNQLESLQEGAEMETIEFESSLRYIFSYAFRSEARSADSERIFVAVGGRTLVISDGHTVPDAANRFDFFKDILLYRSREALAGRLLEMGVDVSIVSLGRFEEKIAFILGANYPDVTANQLWVDKDTLLPLRLLIGGSYSADASDEAEMRYLNWWKIGETHYPSKIEFYQNDQLVRERHAKHFEENANFPDELFNIEHLKTAYPQAPLQPIAPNAVEEPSEIQKTIEDFKRIFE